MNKREVILKSAREIAIMRDSGRIAALALRAVAAAVAPGTSTWELDQIADREIRALGAVPSFPKEYEFKGAICASINDEIVHGIPSKKRVLREGDLMKIDIGAYYSGFHSDTAMTVPVGETTDDARKLIEITERALWAGISAAKAQSRICDISAAIEGSVNHAGRYGIVRQYVGHGIGRRFHEDPQVPNYVDRDHPSTFVLRPGLVIAIEPMINLGTWDTKLRRGDEWTVYTKDGKLSAHFEHTIAITEGDPLVLTLP